MTENTQRVPVSRGDRDRRRSTVLTILASGSALLLAGGLTLATWCSSKKPAPEKIVKKEKVTVKVKGDCPPGPVKGDGECERDKGEHDPLSENFDPKSCGYCGDGKQQRWETEETCPVDFHCGNGKVDRRALYGAFEPLSDGKMTLTTVRVTESCNKRSVDYCEYDCTGRKRPRRPMRHGTSSMATTTTAMTEPMEVTPRPTAKPGAPCKGKYIAVSNAAFDALDAARPSIKKAHVPSGARILVTLTLSVSSSGRIVGKSVYSKCIGTCTNPKLNARKYVGLGAIPSNIGVAPGVRCTLTYKRVYR